MTQRDVKEKVLLYNVLLEGPEGSGKSTAAQTLIKKFSHNYYHDGPPDPSIDEKNFMKYYDLVIESFTPPWVWDRSIIGELIYGPIFRNRCLSTEENIFAKITEMRSTGNGMLSILLLPPFELVQKNFSKRPFKATHEDPESAQVKSMLLEDQTKLKRVWEAYQKLADSNLFDYVLTDYPKLSTWIEVFE